MSIFFNISIITRLFSRLGKSHEKKPLAVRTKPQDLPPEILAQVMSEIEFLKQNHAVDVQNLSLGEKPSIPKKIE